MTKRFPLDLSQLNKSKNTAVSQTEGRAQTTTLKPRGKTTSNMQELLRQQGKSGSVVGQSYKSRPVEPRVVTPTVAPAKIQSPTGLGLTSDAIRLRMVDKLKALGLKDPLVILALQTVVRHAFMDAGLANQAYEDAALPIGFGQTISKPSIVGRMIELMRNGRTMQKVLEIGTGCGYQAAVLSLVATEVYSIERIEGLHEKARQNLRPFRLHNLRLAYGDGCLGLPEVAPFDGIIIAAAGLGVPPALLEQLAIGGRLIAPVVEGDSQRLILIERQANRVWQETMLDSVRFVPLLSGVHTQK